MRLILAFVLSGLLHHAQDVAFMLGHKEMSGERFFIAQVLGIIFEDAVQAATRNFPIPRPIRRTIGYGWTLMFLSWTTPLWFYPTARQGDMGPIVPFSVLDAVLGVRK